jgi:hypothetical protein
VACGAFGGGAFDDCGWPCCCSSFLRASSARRCNSSCSPEVSNAVAQTVLLENADVRYAANTIDDMKKLLLGYRENMRVEIESGVAVTAKTVANLRALTTWPEGLVLDIHVDLDPRLSVVTVERAS